MQQHPFTVTALAQQRQAELRSQADRWRRACSARPERRSRRPANRRWRLATRPASGLSRPS
jgi:hypothetical protein